MSLVAPVRRRQPVVVAATLVCAASMLGLGAWAFLGPESFSRFIDYPPYNRHLIHDAGAFQLGIGVTVLLALWWADGLLVALTGFAVASGLHTVSHAIDDRLGGHAGDVPSLGLLTLVAVVAIAGRLRGRRS
jgi:predicted anti-sigma-YlaC factor YlaD